MDMDINELLKNSRVFSSLDEEARKQLLPKWSLVTLNHHEVLFSQGDPSDSIYLLISGKLSAELTTVTAETRMVGRIEPGEMVGESGALSNEPRSLTVKALKESRLLKLAATDFIQLCHQFPAVMFATVNPIITRSKNIIQMLTAEKTDKHIVVVPANDHISLTTFFEKLREHAEAFPNVLTLSDYQAEFRDKNADTHTVMGAIKQLAQSKQAAHKMLYLLSSYDTPLARVAFKKSHQIYVVAHSYSTPKIDRHILDKMDSRRLQLRALPQLVLLHPEDTLVPENTTAWLSQAEFGLHHHVRFNNTKDYQRLLRFMRGKAVGLVLSGGGTRGWAHLGVMAALRKAKVPIDIIGGTSAGAVVAACYAMSQSVQAAQEKFHDIVADSRHSIAWYNLTWPIISLFNAKNFTQSQINAFGERLIEELWLPYFCVSCNLTKNSEEIHRRGKLWEKLRASTSLPGILPPMVINDDLHLDGGLLNNLPVDVMRQLIGEKGRIIAVELNSFAPRKGNYAFPPILTFMDVLFYKLGLGGKYVFPRFIEAFLRALFVGSAFKSKQNSLAANVLISLNLSKYRLLNSNPNQADSLIEIGFTEGLKQIYEAKNRSKPLSE